ncbi:PD40 domain-containing protein [Candidatus Falkowbacteria bacterium]|nr:MAG: PD40 domain-containing protein [Candidatus Falkowbacteria bacterium]
MTIQYKKISLIAIFCIVVVVVGYLLYVVFFRETIPTPPSETPINNQTGNGLPLANTGTPGTVTPSGNGQLPGQGGTGVIPNEIGGNEVVPATSGDTIADQASFPDISENGRVQFYNQTDNRFYTLDSQGKLVTLSDKQFFGVNNVTWSSSGNKAILEYPDGNKIRYDFATKNQITLPKHWEDFDFSPTDDKIVAKSIGLDPDNRWLVVANDDGSKAKNIESLGENGDKVISSWSPNNQSIAFFVDGIDFNRKEVFFIGQNGENFKSAVTEGRGFQPLWSPKGDELLYSVYSEDNDFKPSLWLVGAQGETIGSNRRPLNLNTWANKCSYTGNELYCAVPISLERGAGMFPIAAANTQDLLYRINPSTGQKDLIPLSNSSSINNISFSPDGTYLYYIEGGTNKLRRVKVR